MTNSDYLLKAAIKKVTEKLNEILIEKIEEATNIAQDAPEILKKEFDNLKESIIEEASRMEKAENVQENEPKNIYQNSEIKKALNEIEVINKQIDQFNKKEIDDIRKNNPGIKIIAHPECPPDVIEASDFAGSTSGMIKYVKDNQPKKVMMVTECSMSDNIQIENPNVDFVKPCNMCPHMKKITLPKILDCSSQPLVLTFPSFASIPTIILPGNLFDKSLTSSLFSIADVPMITFSIP